MKNFPRFSAGDPISAARMNDLVDYAGVSSSHVPNVPGTYFGSQNSNATTEHNQIQVILVFAKEDFSIQTTDHAVEDDCPSGLCNFTDLIRSTNVYTPQLTGRDFYVHDPVAGATGSASKSEGDVFHAVFNKESKRWEVLSAGSSQNLRHATPRRCVGEGWYVMELCDELASSPPDCDPDPEGVYSDSASDAIDDCDMCQISGLDEECGTAASFDSGRPSPVGNGEFVYAYDKRSVPLKLDRECTIAWLGDMCSTSSSNSASNSSSDSVPTRRLYTVLGGDYEQVTIPHDVWECCPIEGIKKTECYTFITDGVMCVGPKDPCAESSSASE